MDLDNAGGGNTEVTAGQVGVAWSEKQPEAGERNAKQTQQRWLK